MGEAREAPPVFDGKPDMTATPNPAVTEAMVDAAQTEIDGLVLDEFVRRNG